MSLLTNWGYTLEELDTLPTLLTAEEFDQFTGGKYSADARIAPNLTAVSDAIRNYCGWHVYPETKCEFETIFDDERVARNGRDILIQLPASHVKSVEFIALDGVDVSQYALMSGGIVKVFDACGYAERYGRVYVEYIAGVPDGFAGALKELASHRVTHALASSNGIQSETAGGVSITYSANWTNSARSTALADDNKEVLAPYRIKGVF